jgi:predicted RND superfamily exporter protein
MFGASDRISAWARRDPARYSSRSVTTENDRYDPLSRRFVGWTLRHGRALWLAALLTSVLAGWRTVHLYRNLRSDIEELLPRNAPSVVAIQELRRRIPGLQFLGVIVDAGPDASPERMAAARRLIDDLAARVRAYPRHLIGNLRLGIAAERAFIEGHAAELLDIEDLHLIRERIDARLHYEYGRETGTLLDDSEGPPPLDFSDIERRYQARAPTSRLDGDRFGNAHLGTTLLLIETGTFSTGATESAELIDRVEADLRDLGGPGAYAPGLAIGYTGDVAISAEETAALVADLTLSSLLVMGAVVLVLLLYFRWWPAALVLTAPLAIATLCAFALANLLGVRDLNSNTAFLGSIIVGNGINFGIIQLGRYVEERRRHLGVEEALVTALWGTRTGTLSAALAAGVAYASLMAMQFRGFQQFGVIGGIGMVLCWVFTATLTPPLVAWLDRAPAFPERIGARWGSGHGVMRALSSCVSRYPRAIVGVALVLTIGALVRVRGFGEGQLEHDLSRLRRADTWKSGEGYWGAKMDTLLGQYLTPTAILADTEVGARRVARELRTAMDKAPLSEMVAMVRTADDFLAPDAAERRTEIEAIRRKLTPNIRERLTPEQRDRVDRMLGTTMPPPITIDQIPDTLLKGLREMDGTIGRVVLVYPKPTAALWDGPRNSAFVEALRTVARVARPSDGRDARVAGGPPLTADITVSMNRDGPLASALAFGGVALTVLALFRFGVATPFVLGALVLGVLWLVALAMVMRIRINFINFIAFPITFGIGVDYAVNVMGRYLRDGSRSVVGAIRDTGGAVALCSMTTMIGYSSLLVAENRGLFLFGFLAVLGEVTCLTAAVVVLPAALILFRGGDSPDVGGQADQPPADPDDGGGAIARREAGATTTPTPVDGAPGSPAAVGARSGP